MEIILFSIFSTKKPTGTKPKYTEIYILSLCEVKMGQAIDLV